MAGTPNGKATITSAFGGSVGGRLFFAGEHTSALYRGTVHGAFQSGQVPISTRLSRSPTRFTSLDLDPRISPAHLTSHMRLPRPPFVPAQEAARAVKASRPAQAAARAVKAEKRLDARLVPFL